MKRKRTIDRPLLAGRLKPYRRPPQAVGTRGPALRLQSSAGEHDSTVASPPLLAEAINRAESIGRSLHIALEGYSRILSVVGRVEDAIRTSIDEDATVNPPFASHIAEMLSKIDAEVDNIRDADTRLLDGHWQSELIDASGRTTVSLTLPRIATDTLGSDAVGGRLSSLTGVVAVSPAIALAILRSSVLWLAGERERVFRLLADVVEPLVGELETIEANCSSAMVAEHADFAADLAGITKLNALAALQSAEAEKSAASRRPNVDGQLRIRHQDDE